MIGRIEMALTVLSVDFLKLRRSLVLGIVFGAPILIAIFGFSNALRSSEQQAWDVWVAGALSIWAFFLLPMSVAALTALTANIEHAGRMWDHLRALPVPRWYLYASKFVTSAILVAFMTAATLLFAIIAVAAAGALRPEIMPVGDVNFSAATLSAAKVFAASSALISVQSWIALRFSTFVPAIAAGIFGTFFAVVAPSSKIGLLSPWQMPLNALSSEIFRSQFAIGAGVGLGILIAFFMIVHLSRQEVL